MAIKIRFIPGQERNVEIADGKYYRLFKSAEAPFDPHPCLARTEFGVLSTGRIHDKPVFEYFDEESGEILYLPELADIDGDCNCGPKAEGEAAPGETDRAVPAEAAANAKDLNPAETEAAEAKTGGRRKPKQT
jgi:hypothetical protein